MFETPDKASCTLHGTLFLTCSTDDVWLSDERWGGRIEEERKKELQKIEGRAAEE